MGKKNLPLFSHVFYFLPFDIDTVKRAVTPEEMAKGIKIIHV